MGTFTRSAFDDFLDRQVEVTNGKSFYARLAGVTHADRGGTPRQGAIADLRSCDELQLVPEPDNPYDPNAVMVLAPDGRQVGYLEARLAGETVRRLRKGVATKAFVSNITGGRNGQPFGCTLGILTFEPAN